MEWHYNDLPPEDPYKRLLVVFDPWDYNRNRCSGWPRFELASYYAGGGMYKEPWHLDICRSVKQFEVLAWADPGDVEEVLNAVRDQE